MRTIRVKLYKFDELSKESQEKAITQFIDRELAGGITEYHQYYDAMTEMEEMKTPWFVGQLIYERFKQDIINEMIEDRREFRKNGQPA